MYEYAESDIDSSVSIASVVACAAVLFSASAASAETLQVGPDDDWCDTINSADPGDVVELAGGDYPGTCAIGVQGAEGRRITVRSADPDQPARFTYDGDSSNVIDLYDGASYLTLKDLRFEPTKQYIAAIKNKGAHHVRIEGCTFRGIGGVSIPVNGSSGVDRRAIEIVDNRFVDLESTGIYIGCHDGSTCKVDDVRIERNLIKNVDSDNVGYGLEIKLNSSAVIRDNTIYNTKGPGLMVYGADDGGEGSVVEGNYVAGSRTDSAILVGGGPAVVRNNVAMGGALASIGTQDYGGRGLQNDIVIAHNTVLSSDNAGISVDNWSENSGNVLAHNAIFNADGPGISPSEPPATRRGNVVCETAADCFERADQAPYDLWPTESGPLHDAVSETSADWMPRRDFMGVERAAPVDIGAFERTDRSVDRSVGGGEARPPRVEPQDSMGDTGVAGDAGDTGGSTADALDGVPGGDATGGWDADREADLGGAETGGGAAGERQSGGGCSTTGSSPDTPSWWALLCALGSLVVWRRRMRGSRRGAAASAP